METISWYRIASRYFARFRVFSFEICDKCIVCASAHKANQIYWLVAERALTSVGAFCIWGRAWAAILEELTGTEETS